VFATLKHSPDMDSRKVAQCRASEISERTLRENFFPPSRSRAPHESAFAVASYNEIDGVPSHANSWLLGTVAARRVGLHGRHRERLLRIEQLTDLHHVESNYTEPRSAPCTPAWNGPT